MASIAAISARGQIVLPIAVRRRLKLGEGSQVLVIADDENILLKPIKEPSMEEFYAAVEKAQQWAQEVGLTEEDINATIKEVRAERRAQIEKEVECE